MGNKILLLFCAVAIYSRLSASTSIQCTYSSNSAWTIVKISYDCGVSNDISITSRELATITSISGDHHSGKTNFNVFGFFIAYKTCNYFPRGLETYFINLKVIYIYESRLKEIHQEDLVPFPKLAQLGLWGNQLEVLEEGLFDFNPDLEFIDITSNQITHIQPDVFVNLNKLRYLRLSSNICIKEAADDSRVEVDKVLQTVESRCVNSEFLSLMDGLKSLENDFNSSKFAKKLTTFEKTLKSSKFSNYRPLNYKFKALKKPKLDNKIITNTSTLIASIDKILTNIVDLKSSCGASTSLDKFESIISGLKTDQSKALQLIDNICTKASIDQVLLNQQNILNSHINVKTSLDSLHSTSKLSQDSLKSSLEDIEAALNSLKSSQNDVRMSINKIKSSQYEMKVQIDEQKMERDENFDDKVKALSDDIKEQLRGFETDNVERFTKIENYLSSTRHKITMTIDEKIKGIEKRLMKKIEDVLEEKLNRIFKKMSNQL